MSKVQTKMSGSTCCILVDDYFEWIGNKTTVLSEIPSSTLNKEIWLAHVHVMALCEVPFSVVFQ